MAGDRHSQYLYSNKKVIIKSSQFLIENHKCQSSNIDDSKMTSGGPWDDFDGAYSSQQYTHQNIITVGTF